MSTKTIAAALAAATLLSACVSQSAYDRNVHKTSIYQQLDAQLKAELGADPAQIEPLHHLVRLTLANGQLFADGGWELNEAGKALLAKLAPALKGLTGQRIVVKSFTDSEPIGAVPRERFANSVELSKARAGAVADYLKAQGVPAALITTTGLGQTHPVASNDTEEGRARNRRVEIDIVQAPA